MPSSPCGHVPLPLVGLSFVADDIRGRPVRASHVQHAQMFNNHAWPSLFSTRLPHDFMIERTKE